MATKKKAKKVAQTQIEVVKIGTAPMKVTTTATETVGSILRKAGIEEVRKVKVRATRDGVNYNQISLRTRIGANKELLVVGNIKGA